MVAIDDDPRSQYLIRRAYRRAQRQQSEWLAVFVETPSWVRASPEARARLEENLRLAEDLGAECIRVQGKDIAKTLVAIAHEKNIDSIVLGHSRHGVLHRLFKGSVVDKLLHLARDLDLHIVATDRNDGKRAP